MIIPGRADREVVRWWYLLADVECRVVEPEWNQRRQLTDQLLCWLKYLAQGIVKVPTSGTSDML